MSLRSFFCVFMFMLGTNYGVLAQPAPLDDAERIASEKMLELGRRARACVNRPHSEWLKERGKCDALHQEWNRAIDARDAARANAERRLATGGSQRPTSASPLPSQLSASKQTATTKGICVTVNQYGQNCVTCQVEFKSCSQNKRDHPILKQCTYKNLICSNSCGSSSPIKIEYEYIARDADVPGNASGYVVTQLDPENVKTRGDILGYTPYCRR